MIPIEKLLHGKKALRFFGDVHGNIDPFVAMAEDAIARDIALFSLGDINDRGPDSPACMELACDLHDAGVLDAVPGNHCVKLMDFMRSRPVAIKKRGLATTLAQLAEHPDGKLISERFFDFVSEAPIWRNFGKIHAVHAAWHPLMMAADGPVAAHHDKAGSRTAFHALYGERGAGGEDETGKRTYGWVDRVPAGHAVLIGHHVISLEEIVERRGALGGRAIHLDTGADRGGKLTWIDVPSEVILEGLELPHPSFAEALAA